MATEIYCKLIDELCEKIGIEDSQSLYENCDIQISGTEFTLTQGTAEEEDEDGLYIYTDFGEIPEDRIANILPRVLEANLFMTGDNAPRFGFNRELRHVVMMNRLSISQINSESLLNVLENLINYVPEWRAETLEADTN